MIWQLRTYEIRPGCMADFRVLWRHEIVPARTDLGFVVQGGWVDESANVFVWLVGHEAPAGWDAAEQAYYADGRRDAFSANPRDLVAKVHTRLLVEA